MYEFCCRGLWNRTETINQLAWPKVRFVAGFAGEDLQKRLGGALNFLSL